ncbi:hypothetical protein N0V90_000882 [Kalmusia sp. IMI 367209]|nr:hypothetical protein N0V90_000882 [Kalmusia sp. IMI 367209]
MNQQVNSFRSNHASAACPIPTHLGSVSHSFLAPALKEALNSSEYASNTHIVPGEADDWCAPYANENPRSIIFSSDTDLLLYDYPQEVRIIYLKDVDLHPEPKFRGYSPPALCQSLGLSSLVPLAYCLMQDPWMTDSLLLEKAKAIDDESKLYRDFRKRYITTATILSKAGTHWTDPSLQRLDVRISELAHQSLKTTFTPIIYLPFLVEDQYRTSAWNVGADLRTIAYSLLTSDRCKAQEYRRKAQKITIHDICLYSPQELYATIQAHSNSTNAWLHWAAEEQVPPDLVWPLFAIGLVLPKLKSPPRVALVLRMIDADFDNTWDFIHLNACLQAALYSLRCLKQCVDVWLSIRSESSPQLLPYAHKLHDALQSMGSIAELFTVPGQARRSFGDLDSLQELIVRVYASVNVEIPVEQPSTRKTKKQQKDAHRKERLKREASTKMSSNAFKVLGNM